jgi:hypothetical protein
VKTEPAPRQRILETAAAVGADRGVEFRAAVDASGGVGMARAIDTDNREAGTTGSYVPRPMSAIGATVAPDRERSTRNVTQSIPQPRVNNGIWLEFNGARWYPVGLATPFSPDRFVPVGEYRGFPVYRDQTRQDGRIWVALVKDGPVAPYTKR